MAHKKLHAALDLFRTQDALAILEKIGPYVDIIEVGTPLVVAEGARAVAAIKERHPEKVIFADIKVMDGGSEVPKSVIEAGCDMFSVLGAADDTTLRAAIALAHEKGVKVMVDMCNVRDLSARAHEVVPFGPDYLCCHVGYDRQSMGADPVKELRALDVVDTPKAIAGGIKLATFEQAVNSSAEVIISGGAIYNADDPAEVTRQMRAILDAYNDTY